METIIAIKYIICGNMMLEWRCVHDAAGTQASPQGSLGRDKFTSDCCMPGFVLSASFILCFHYFRIDKH